MSVLATNLSGDTLLNIAAREGYLDLVDYLANDAVTVERTKTSLRVIHSEPDHRNLGRKTALHLAVMPAEERSCLRDGEWDFSECLEPEVGEMGQMQIVGMLLELGANPNIRTARGETPLLLITKNKWTSGIDFMVRRGADVHLKDYRGISPLLMAAGFTGSAACVRRLLQAGANPEDTDRKGNTALILASSARNLEVVYLLTATGCNVNHSNLAGVTAYMVACQRGNVQIAQHLLEHGAERSAFAERALTSDKAEQLRVAASAMAWGRGVENPLTLQRADPDALDALMQMPLFMCLSENEIAVLVTEVCRTRFVEPGEVLVKRGTAAKYLSMIYLLAGQLRIDTPSKERGLPFTVVDHRDEEAPVLWAGSLLSREPAEHTVIATGTKTIKLLTLSPTSLNEYLMSTETTSLLLSATSDRTLQNMRTRLREAVAARFVTPKPPAWAMIDKEQPYDPTDREISIMMERTGSTSWTPPVPPTDRDDISSLSGGSQAGDVHGDAPGVAHLRDADALAEIDAVAAAAMKADGFPEDSADAPFSGDESGSAAALGGAGGAGEEGPGTDVGSREADDFESGSDDEIEEYKRPEDSEYESEGDAGYSSPESETSAR